MKVSQVRISNILGIDELEFEPGSSITEITGRNGEGKTSVLEAIKSVLRSGHDATLLRKGAAKGEVVLVLEDGRAIRKRVSDADSKVDLLDENGKKTVRPFDTIKAITDLLSVNPVEFLRATKKDRARVLLESMPIEIDQKVLSERLGMDIQMPANVHALSAIETIHKRIYDDRTGTNRALREKQGTVQQLRMTIPEAPAGAEGSEEELEKRLREIEAARDAEMERIRVKLQGLRDEAQRKIDAIRSELAAMETKASAQRERSLQKFADDREPVAAHLAAIRANRSAAAAREQATKLIGQLEQECGVLEVASAAQDAALAALDAYKGELLASLPIPGLEVRDGEIFRDGVTFDRLNTAQQVQIAIDIAKLRAGELGLICVDGLELLDTDTYEAFCESALDSELQLLVTRVSDDRLQIRST